MNPLLRLLIVEDSTDDVILSLFALRQAGYQVTHAVVDNPGAMRAALEGQDWDVITSDHSMPRFSAPAALALAKELCPDLPFIIVSGEIDLNQAVSLMREGATDYVQKRELGRLAPAIARALNEVEMRREGQKMQKTLEISALRYRRLFEACHDGLLILDADTGLILDVNPFLMEFLGYSKDELMGKALWQIGAFKDSMASKDAFDELQRKGYVRYENLPVEPRAGQLKSVEFVCNVYSENGGKVAQCNIRDISARKATETEIRNSAKN
jgi:PAS domain S-box-containing protein